jgi:hypothetical protein
MSDVDLLHVRALAEAVLNRFGYHRDGWRVVSVYPAEPTASAEDASVALTSQYLGPQHDHGSGDANQIAVVVGSSEGDDDSQVTAYYSFDVPEPDAIAEMASQIQDWAIEETHGLALPPCPDHVHPLAPRVVAGVAVWECPAVPEHHREPIVGG